MKTLLVALVLALCETPFVYGQLVERPQYPFEQLRFGMSLHDAITNTLRNPEPTLSRDEKTGKVRLVRGLFFYSRRETLFDIPASVSYAFTQSDSTFRYVLIKYIEIDGVPGWPEGGRDSLWNRITRRYGTAYSETRTGQLTQREWIKGGTTIISNKADALGRVLGLSLTPTKKK